MESKRSKSTKAITGSLILIYFMYALFASLLSVLLSEIINEFGLEGTRQGLMKSFLSMGAIITLIMMMLRGTTKNKYLAIVAAGGLAGAAQCGIGNSRWFAILLGCFAILGISIGYIETMVNALMVEIHNEEKERYLGIMHACYGIGSMLVPYIVTAFHNCGARWRTVYTVSGCIMFLVIILFTLVSRNCSSVSIRQSFRNRTNTGDYWSFFRIRRNVLLSLCMFFYMIMLSTVSLWLVRYVSVDLGNPVLGNLSFSILWGVIMIDRILVPKIRIRTVLVLAGGMLVGSLVLAVCLLTGNAGLVCIGCAIFGLCTGHTIPSIISIASDDKRNISSVITSIMALMQNIASFISPIIASFIFSIYSFRVSMSLLCLNGVVSAWFAIRVTRTRYPGNYPKTG